MPLRDFGFGPIWDRFGLIVGMSANGNVLCVPGIYLSASRYAEYVKKALTKPLPPYGTLVVKGPILVWLTTLAIRRSPDRSYRLVWSRFAMFDRTSITSHVFDWKVVWMPYCHVAAGVGKRQTFDWICTPIIDSYVLFRLNVNAEASAYQASYETSALTELTACLPAPALTEYGQQRSTETVALATNYIQTSPSAPSHSTVHTHGRNYCAKVATMSTCNWWTQNQKNKFLQPLSMLHISE